MRDKIIITVIIIIILSTLGFGIFATVNRINHQANEVTAAYNNGICTECGGEYHFSGADHSQYYYTCIECDHTIRSYKLMK